MGTPPLPDCLDEAQLLDLADGVAPEALRVRAEAHLDGCATCRELLAAFLQARAPSASGEVAADTRAVTTVLEDTHAPSGLRVRALERGTVLGRYVVLERLGAGGMGVVYAAYDPSIDRRIGLKLLQLTPGVAGGAERLLGEARTAARTQHPNVVAIHDVGVLGELVFIAMELVDGGTLRQHLKARRPGWREVVHLYLQAGRGLAAAHAAGIVHRDFKPDNVLVDRAGRVRVTDFGLARFAFSLEPSASPPGSASSLGTSPTSGSAGVATTAAGTPGYIAPEALAGGLVDARSDQFSFCVALYEGLHGRRPDTSRARGAPEREAVPRAVQAVVERGLSPAPEDRHASMDALLTALERAVSPPLARHAGGLGAGVGVAAAVAAILVARGPRPCSDDFQRLAGAWDAARSAALERTFTASGAPAAPSLHAAVSRALDAYAAEWTDAHREACEATHVRREQSEAALDLRMYCLERRKRELGATVDVLLGADAEAVMRAPQAVRALEPVSGCADVEALARPLPLPARGPQAARVRAAHERLAEAKARDNAGRWKEAVGIASAVASEAEAVGYKPLLGEALLAEGRARLHLREEKAAAVRLRRAALASQAGRDDERAAEAFIQLVYVEGELAERPEQAELWRELAQSLLERIGGDDRLEGNLAFHQGVVLVRQGRHADALPLLQKCLAMRERAFGKDHLSLTDALLTLGTAQRGVGRVEEALATQRRVLDLLLSGYGPDHPYVAMTLNNLATTLVRLRRYDEGLARFEESIATFERIHGPGQPAAYLISLYGNMGATNHERGNFEEARRTLERAWRLSLGHHPPGHPNRTALGGSLAVALVNLGRTDEALALLDTVDRELDTATAEGRNSVRNAEFHVQRALVLLRAGRFEQGEGEAREAVVLLRKLGARGELAGALAMQGMALFTLGRLPEAERVAREALALREETPSPQENGVLDPRAVLGQVLLARGDAAGARTLLEQSVSAGEQDGLSPLALSPARFALARALSATGEDAARARALATTVRETVAPTAEPRVVRLEDVDAFLASSGERTGRVHSSAR